MTKRENASIVEKLSLSRNVSIPLLTLSLVVGAAAVAGAQSSVRVSPGSVTASKGGKSVVIESTLTGVGIMLSGARDARSGRVEVEYDQDAARYLVMANGEAQIEMDASTGRYTVLNDDSAVDVTIRNSLSGAGAILRAVSDSGVIELSGAQVRAMKRSWRTYGMNDAEIELQLQQLEGVGREVDAALRDADAAIGEANEALAEVDAILGGSNARTRRAPRTQARRGGPGSNLYCSANQDLVLQNRNIESAGPALVVEGNCDVIISDSSIVSTDDAAIIVQGNGTVIIEDSRIEGAAGAIRLSGSADVEAVNSQFFGDLIQSGNADFQDRGGNLFR